MQLNACQVHYSDPTEDRSISIINTPFQWEFDDSISFFDYRRHSEKNINRTKMQIQKS